MLSVLIPCYNYDARPLLKKLSHLRSLQTIDIEIILWDDCSTNKEIESNNKKTAKKLSVSYYKNEQNFGRATTRQNLARKAEYNKLLFMDVDVMPVNDDFFERFEIRDNQHQLIFGGIHYIQQKPAQNKMLRWKYGNKKEAKTLEERLKNPYLSIVSGCFLIEKNTFIKSNTYLGNSYGVDVVFCRNLEHLSTKVKHINNPVFHSGLETSESFLKKSRKGLEALVQFEKQKLIPKNYKKIQKTYLKLKKSGLLNAYIFVIGIFKTIILKNLKGSQPSIFAFDLYRLYYFSKLQNS